MVGYVFSFVPSVASDFARDKLILLALGSLLLDPTFIVLESLKTYLLIEGLLPRISIVVSSLAVGTCGFCYHEALFRF